MLSTRNRRWWTVTLAALLMTTAWAAAQDATAPEGEAPAQPRDFRPADAPSTPAPAEGSGQAPAENGENKDGSTEEENKGGGGGLFGGSNMMLFVLLGGIILLYVWMGRGRKKTAAKRQEMLSSLKKGDKVTSIGGVVGTVIEVREDEVTVKVDETNNVRMRFARWAIRGVGEEAKAEKPEDQHK